MNDAADTSGAAATPKGGQRGSTLTSGLLGAIVGGLVGVGIGAFGFRSAPVPAPHASVSSARSTACSSAPAAASARSTAASASLAARAGAGDSNAVQELRARPREERTADEVVALARAAALEKRGEILELKRKISLVPRLISEDKRTLSRIKELSSDREVATDMLAALATLPNNAGTNLLYSLYRDMRDGSESAEFALDLLYSKDVQPKLSKGLAALLELRKARDCPQALQSLKRLKDDGDRRAIPSLMRFYNKRGCGPKGADDCWACLRSPDVLKETTAEVAKRSGR